MNESTRTRRALPFDMDYAAAAALLPYHIMAGIPVETKTLVKENKANKEIRTKMYVEDGIIKAKFFKDGTPTGGSNIMCDIADVAVIEKNDRPKVVIVTFADKTKEKAVLADDDTYSLEQGISICLMKKLLGKETSFGGSLYNKLIKRAMDVMEENKKAAADAVAKAEADKAKAEKQAKKQKERREKYEAVAREYEIGIQAEAYVRAYNQIKEESKAELTEALDGLGNFFDQLIAECEAEEAKDCNPKTPACEGKSETVSEMNESHV